MEKLRKALEKVKKDTEKEENVEIISEAKIQEPSFKISGKVSPTYTQSRSYEVDPMFLINNHCIGISSESREIEFYKILRTQIIQRTEPNR